MSDDGSQDILQAGDKVLVGGRLLTVSEGLAREIRPGDRVVAVGNGERLALMPRQVVEHVEHCVSLAVGAFQELSRLPRRSVTDFYEEAARLLADEAAFTPVRVANEADVASAKTRGRSTTRLVLSEAMRRDMVAALMMWRDSPAPDAAPSSVTTHSGWVVEEWHSPLGVVGFVFEGRPNVFADATGVLRSGNTAVFRIGGDALGTARALMDRVVRPALRLAGLPEGSVVLVESTEHSAGWALFSDPRLSLAVARGSGEAVADLGSLARQAGTPVSLHGTGGAWMLVGESFEPSRLGAVIEHSLDRKVCNTLNVVCVPSARAEEALEVVWRAAMAAGERRGRGPRLHAVNGAEKFLPSGGRVVVARADGEVDEPQVSTGAVESLGREFEWEENPEFHVVVVDTLEESVTLFNRHAPQFIVSVVSEDAEEIERAWSSVNSPFFGDGFTRWVDGQFALRRPELGLSNWQAGRLFARGGILSGDSVFTVRMRMRQEDAELRR